MTLWFSRKLRIGFLLICYKKWTKNCFRDWGIDLIDTTYPPWHDTVILAQIEDALISYINGQKMFGNIMLQKEQMICARILVDLEHVVYYKKN